MGFCHPEVESRRYDLHRQGRRAAPTSTLQYARFNLTGSSIRVAQRSGLKSLDPVLGFARAELAGASVPEQSLSRIGSGAAQAGTAVKHWIEGRPQLQCRQPAFCVGSALKK